MRNGALTCTKETEGFLKKKDEFPTRRLTKRPNFGNSAVEINNRQKLKSKEMEQHRARADIYCDVSEMPVGCLNRRIIDRRGVPSEKNFQNQCSYVFDQNSEDVKLKNRWKDGAWRNPCFGVMAEGKSQYSSSAMEGGSLLGANGPAHYCMENIRNCRKEYAYCKHGDVFQHYSNTAQEYSNASISTDHRHEKQYYQNGEDLDCLLHGLGLSIPSEHSPLELNYYGMRTVNSANPGMEDFLNNSQCSEMILKALILKIGGCQSAKTWVNKFKPAIFFLPKTLLFGYILILRLVSRCLLESVFDLPNVYLACCVTAAKSQFDGHVDSINFITEDVDVQKINYLEGLVLNRLEYEVHVGENDAQHATEEIIWLCMRGMDPPYDMWKE